MCLEFAAKSLAFTQQQVFPVYYRTHFVGKLITDLIVDQKVIVEAKVVDEIGPAHIAQVLSYLSITGLKVGPILNFKPISLTVKRIANIYLKNQ